MTQYQLSNGDWQDIDEQYINNYLDAALKRESVIERGITTRQQLMELLETGEKIKYDAEIWYGWIRNKNAQPKPRITQPDYPTGRRLSCGHTVHYRHEVMSASLGTSCADCYDRMSN